jgi:hypothetical protein
MRYRKDGCAYRRGPESKGWGTRDQGPGASAKDAKIKFTRK